MQVLSQTHPKARKDHRCDHCHKRILAGEVYDRAFLKDGRDTWSWASHQDCSRLAARLHDDMDLSWDEGVCLLDEWKNARDELRAYADAFPAVIARLEGSAP